MLLTAVYTCASRGVALISSCRRAERSKLHALFLVAQLRLYDTGMPTSGSIGMVDHITFGVKQTVNNPKDGGRPR